MGTLGRTQVATTLVLTLATAVSSTACGAGPAEPTARRQRLLVFAAASLTEPFETLGRRFEAAHPDVAVTFNFASSSALAAQITQGAPADVFASASTQVMDGVLATDAVEEPNVFARNTMAIAVPPDNPARVTSLNDLARSDVAVAMCRPEAPCGALGRQVLSAAGLSVRPVTEEPDVKATLTKVRLGEVDAALVYSSDVRAAGAAVTPIAIPSGVNATTSYPIAVVAGTASHGEAQRFVDLVLSGDGANVLQDDGFLSP